MEDNLIRLSSQNAVEIAASIRFRHDRSTEVLDIAPSSSDFLDRLMQEQLDSDAIRFLAHALPIRESIWWGVLCLWRVFGPNPDEKEIWAIQAAINWVLDPSETRRRAADSAARAVGNNSAPGCLAHAVFWSGGSMSAANRPAVAPPETSAARAVGGAILLAAARARKASRCRELRREFVLLGLEVARGAHRWDAASSKPESAPCAEETTIVEAGSST